MEGRAQQLAVQYQMDSLERRYTSNSIQTHQGAVMYLR